MTGGRGQGRGSRGRRHRGCGMVVSWRQGRRGHRRPLAGDRCAGGLGTPGVGTGLGHSPGLDTRGLCRPVTGLGRGPGRSKQGLRRPMAGGPTDRRGQCCRAVATGSGRGIREVVQAVAYLQANHVPIGRVNQPVIRVEIHLVAVTQ